MEDGGRPSGSKGGISVFLRVRPTEHPSPGFSLDESGERVSFHVPRGSDGYVNNQRELYQFKFDQVLGMRIKQDEVFSRVARKAVDHVLGGINATVFAYGQTGSGKTFTMTGGAERYADRGMIPRTLQYIFQELDKHTASSCEVHVSYMEIYNNGGFDLLDHNAEETRGSELLRVTLQEDDGGGMHMTNLSQHRAGNVEEALNLLFLGDTNRMVSETPMNLASSRSHCIFTITVVSRIEGSDTFKKAKLNLVDLAGSERVFKTMPDGTLLREAKYINGSLLFLEQVIIALHEKATVGRQHIPYRNSLMTMVLKDSLGGNCVTTMVATVQVENQFVDEAISTCRFAQRVALIKNEAKVNEEIDPSLLIRRLRAEVRMLKAEVALLRGDGDHGEMVESEKVRLYSELAAYVEDRSPSARPPELRSMTKVLASFAWLKDSVLDGRARLAAGPPATDSEVDKKEEPLADSAQIRRLQLQLQQRDSEISILVSMIRRKEAHQTTLGTQTDTSQVTVTEKSVDEPPQAATARRPLVVRPLSAASSDGDANQPASSRPPDRGEAFQLFRNRYPQTDAIEDNKALLKAKYAEAKSVGDQVNASRSRVNALKAVVEQLRVERAMQGLLHSDDGGSVEDPEETRNTLLVEQEKHKFKAGFARLKELKGEIEHIQLLLEKMRVKMQKEFEAWYVQRYVDDSTSASGFGVASQSRPPPLPRRSSSEVRSTSEETQPLRASASASSLQDARRAAAPILTGDEKADADILRFYEAKEKYLKKKKGEV